VVSNSVAVQLCWATELPPALVAPERNAAILCPDGELATIRARRNRTNGTVVGAKNELADLLAQLRVIPHGNSRAVGEQPYVGVFVGRSHETPIGANDESLDRTAQHQRSTNWAGAPRIPVSDGVIEAT
jgi:hypothetical protein